MDWPGVLSEANDTRSPLATSYSPVRPTLPTHLPPCLVLVFELGVAEVQVFMETSDRTRDPLSRPANTAAQAAKNNHE